MKLREFFKIGAKQNSLKCPYCSFVFSEMPKRKRKCPECKEWIFRKRLPSENEKRLVTEAEAKKIDEVWEQYYIDQQIIEVGKNKYNSIKRLLLKKEEPASHQDILIGVYLESTKKAYSSKNIVEYRSNLINIAELYFEKRDMHKALIYYLEEAFFQGNGHFSQGKFQSFGMRISPGLINMIKKCINELDKSESEVHNIFVKANTLVHHELNTPLHPQDVWHDQLKNLIK